MTNHDFSIGVPQEFTPDVDGMVAFAELAPGTYEIVASAEDHYPVTRTVTITDGGEEWVSIPVLDDVSGSLMISSPTNVEKITITRTE